uniref:Uncharacterized protein n=1 Tax=Rhizophora mucronata TaxID=61149 RepID=A0A2P2QGU9_RHIMU
MTCRSSICRHYIVMLS